MSSVGGQEISVLHVEEDTDFANRTAARLEQTVDQLSVDVVRTGTDALDELDERDIDCILADYHITDINGLELFERVQTKDSDISFVLYTGRDSEVMVSEATAAGVTEYVHTGIEEDSVDLLADRVWNAIRKKAAERRAEKTERWYRALFEHSTDAIARIEYEDAVPRIESVNATFRERFIDESPPSPDDDGNEERGHGKADAVERHDDTNVGYDDTNVGRDIDEVIGYQGEHRPVRSLTEHTANGDEMTADITVQTSSGIEDYHLELVPIDTDDGDGGWFQEVDTGASAFVIYTDVTDQQLHQERFRAFVEQSTDIITVLSPDGTVEYESPSLERIAGYDPKSVIGDDIFEYVHPDDREDVMEKFAEGVEDHELTPTVEYRFRHADGSYRWFESRGNNQLHNPVVEGFVVNSRDITERRAREQELKRQNERLDEFGSVVSHDLKNPLNVAGGHLELAQSEFESEHLDEIEMALQRMEDLLDDLLTIARVGETTTGVETIDLGEIADQAWATVETEDATLDVQVDGYVRAEASRLQEVFENLYRNAVEHGRQDVTVTVGRMTDPDGFYVADDGPGIDPGDRDAVFESGYTSTEDGTGFGLAIADEIVNAHDWRIEVVASDSGGARFDVTDVEFVDE